MAKGDSGSIGGGSSMMNSGMNNSPLNPHGPMSNLQQMGQVGAGSQFMGSPGVQSAYGNNTSPNQMNELLHPQIPRQNPYQMAGPQYNQPIRNLNGMYPGQGDMNMGGSITGSFGMQPNQGLMGGGQQFNLGDLLQRYFTSNRGPL